MAKRAGWRRGAVLTALVMGGGCTATDPGAPHAINDRFGVYDVGWDTGATLAVFVGLIEAEGRVAVCAAYRVRNESAVSSNWNDMLLDAVVVQQGNRPLVQGLGFAPELSPGGPDDRAYLGREAACRQTGVAWTPGDAETLPKVSVPPLQVGYLRDRIRARPGQVVPTRL